MGADDERTVSLDQLVEALPLSTRAVAPGDHGTAVSSPEFTAVIVDFLTGR